MHVVVIEDERALRQGLEDLLRGAGHEVEAAENGVAGLALARAGTPEIVVLDLMLPDINGLEVCRQLRIERPDVAILMLTARGAEDDKVAGFAAGADDYVTKPFGARELLARIDALGRRLGPPSGVAEVLEADGCRLDLGLLVAERAGATTPLTLREVEILRWLYHHRQRAVSRSELLERVWGARGDLQTRTVDMTIAKLRQKIEIDPASPRLVLTVTGVGYRWGGGS